MAEELAALRSQLHTMTRQRDILKKALGILGQESLNTIN
jgi:transposase-like protein